MPQLDVSTYTSQLFWLAVCFSILYWTLKNHIIPHLHQLLQKRWEHTEGMQEEAGHLQKQAEVVNQACEKSLEEAREKSHEIVNQAAQKSRLHISQKRSEFSELIQRRLTSAKAKLKKEEEKAENLILKHLEPLTIESIVKISRGALSRNHIEKATHQKFSNDSSPASQTRRA
jgi:F-type H+-transporting ATPase subunit b